MVNEWRLCRQVGKLSRYVVLPLVHLVTKEEDRMKYGRGTYIYCPSFTWGFLAVDQILTPSKIGSDDSCFFYSGGLRTLSSDEFEKVLRELFQFQITTWEAQICHSHSEEFTEVFNI
jgi:hypothetical protein